MASVQVYGIKDVLEWANNLDCPAWGLFDGKRMICKYEGNDGTESLPFLEQFLRRFHKHSIATYTLKFFEQPAAGELKIKEKSECDAGSFNFKLSESEDEYLEKRSGRENLSLEYEKRLIALEEEKNSDPQTIGEILQQPEKVKEYIEVISMVKNLLSGSTIPIQPAYIGNVTRAGINDSNNGSDQMRLITAINILEVNDPNIMLHLEKLARISQDNKPVFNQLIAMLDNIP